MIREAKIAFLRDRQSQNRSHHTIDFYKSQVTYFENYCVSQGVDEVENISPDLIRGYLISLDGEHNAGGKHARYRGVNAFMRWYWNEMDLPEWTNPMRKVPAPKKDEREIDPVTPEELKALLNTCDNSFNDVRDYALMLFLYDTGMRVEECTLCKKSDVDLFTGEVFIRRGKGGKPRFVYVGRYSTKALRRYLRLRGEDVNESLWVTSFGSTYRIHSIQTMLAARSEQAGIKRRSPHKFRKAFATDISDNVSIFDLQLLTGDTLEVLEKHYVKKKRDRLREVYQSNSPVDKMFR